MVKRILLLLAAIEFRIIIRIQNSKSHKSNIRHTCETHYKFYNYNNNNNNRGVNQQIIITFKKIVILAIIKHFGPNNPFLVAALHSSVFCSD